jgi:hypothetical protein
MMVTYNGASLGPSETKRSENTWVRMIESHPIQQSLGMRRLVEFVGGALVIFNYLIRGLDVVFPLFHSFQMAIVSL